MALPKKLTIYSDGFGNDVRVMNEDGMLLDGVRSVTINMQAGQFNVVELEMHGSSTTITGHTDGCSFQCPLCAEITEHKCDS